MNVHERRTNKPQQQRRKEFVYINTFVSLNNLTVRLNNTKRIIPYKLANVKECVRCETEIKDYIITISKQKQQMTVSCKYNTLKLYILKFIFFFFKIIRLASSQRLNEVELVTELI